MQIRYSDDLAPCPGGIGEGPDDVHHRRDRELPPHRTDVTHRRVHERSEHENDPRVSQRSLHHRHWNLDRYSKCLEDVGTSTPGGEGPIAVLGYADSGSRRHDCRRGRDVEGRDRAASGAAGVNQVIGIVC